MEVAAGSSCKGSFNVLTCVPRRCFKKRDNAMHRSKHGMIVFFRAGPASTSLRPRRCLLGGTPAPRRRPWGSPAHAAVHTAQLARLRRCSRGLASLPRDRFARPSARPHLPTACPLVLPRLGTIRSLAPSRRRGERGKGAAANVEKGYGRFYT